MQGDEPGSPEAGSASGVPFNSLGTWLRTQREARGVSLVAVAESSKISRRYLEALESDKFDALPAPVFVRGFLREYARVVGLDGDEVVNFYLMVVPAKTQPVMAPRTPVGQKRAADPAWLGYGLLVGAILALFLGIAAGISFWAKRHAPSRSSAEVAAPRAEAPRAPAPDAAAAAPVAPAGNAPETAQPGTGSPQGIATQEAAAPAPSPQSPPVAAPNAAAPLQVVLEFEQDCWVEVVVDGQRRSSELKAGGETLAIEAKDSVVLTLGNAPAVRVELNGRPLTLPSQGTRVVHDFRIDRALLEGAVPEAAAGT